jgi:two-component system, LytTR family, response regulator
MRKIRTIIVEDKVRDYDLLLGLIQEGCQNLEVLGVAKGIDSAYKLIIEHKPDLVICDIELEEECTGFDLVEKLLTEKVPITFEIIFMTAYSELHYATKAFEYAAIDYLTKPFGVEQLQKAVNRLEDKLSMKEATEVLENFLEILKNEDTEIDFITVHLVKNKTRKIPISSILYIEADTVQSIFYLTNGEKVIALRNLGKYRQILELDHNFFSISHSMTVNLNHAEDYHHKDLKLELKNGDFLKASRQYGKKLNTYLKDNNLLQKPDKKTVIEKLKGFLGL